MALEVYLWSLERWGQAHLLHLSEKEGQMNIVEQVFEEAVKQGLVSELNKYHSSLCFLPYAIFRYGTKQWKVMEWAGTIQFTQIP